MWTLLPPGVTCPQRDLDAGGTDVGRGLDNNCDVSVSRNHARLVIQDGSPWLTFMSKNDGAVRAPGPWGSVLRPVNAQCVHWHGRPAWFMKRDVYLRACRMLSRHLCAARVARRSVGKTRQSMPGHEVGARLPVCALV